MASRYKSFQNLFSKMRSTEQLCKNWMYGEGASFDGVSNHFLKSQRANISHYQSENFQWKDEKRFRNPPQLQFLAVSILGLGVLKNKKVKSEDDPDLQEKMEIENRVRQYSGRHDVFDFFASYKDEDKKGELRGLMGVKDFCASVTPGSKPSELFGACNYKILPTGYERSEIYEQQKVETSPNGGVLNKIQKEGLLTFMDFCFLLNIITTPRRFMDMAFHAFDVSADGAVGIEEYTHVMSHVVGYDNGQDEIQRESEVSGLITYLFGEMKNKLIRKEDFFKFQRDLINDLLWLEFSSYLDENQSIFGTISEEDFCRHILAQANLTKKKKADLINKIHEAFRTKRKGITFEMFRSFHHILFGARDMKRAIEFMDPNKVGITRMEFSDIGRWVADMKIDHHLVDVIYELLDEHGHGKLTLRELSPVLLNWRNTRGFRHSCIQLSFGHYDI